MLLSFDQLKELIKTTLDMSESYFALCQVSLIGYFWHGRGPVVYGLWKGVLRPSEFHLLGSSQPVPEGEQAAGCLRNLTCMPDAHGPGSAWLWTLWLSL